jgi:hypothetical protein
MFCVRTVFELDAECFAELRRLDVKLVRAPAILRMSTPWKVSVCGVVQLY